VFTVFRVKTVDGKTTWTKEDYERFVDPPARREVRPADEPPPYDIPFWPWTQPLLAKIKPRLKVGKPVFEWRSLRHVYRRACERLDLPSYELRTLRRCYIVHLRELNIHDAVVANFQGHADSALIQKTYGKNMSAEFVAREIAKAFADRGSTP
jgi:integrase